MENIQVKVKDIVLKPIDEVFDAIANPEKLSGFFISKASQPIRKGENIIWYFDDFGGELTVRVKEVIPNTLISFNWTASGIDAAVKIILESINSTKTSILITEENFPLDKDGVKQALGQTQGWTDFICCMKAFLYCGVNLRDGRSKQIK
jgi:uncharacterized protein YndB with AHSA1/START domain